MAVDFGAVLSGVACGISPNYIHQIIWPEAHRKVPTCLVYDAIGRVVAWGLGAQDMKLEKDWTRCEMSLVPPLLHLPFWLTPNIGSNCIWIPLALHGISP